MVVPIRLAATILRMPDGAGVAVAGETMCTTSGGLRGRSVSAQRRSPLVSGICGRPSQSGNHSCAGRPHRRRRSLSALLAAGRPVLPEMQSLSPDACPARARRSPGHLGHGDPARTRGRPHSARMRLPATGPPCLADTTGAPPFPSAGQEPVRPSRPGRPRRCAAAAGSARGPPSGREVAFPEGQLPRRPTLASCSPGPSRTRHHVQPPRGLARMRAVA